ncbi:MAG: hypothetical protein WC966_00805 [Bradymonadales bacterium]|jgi:hypothetical protein
MLKKIAPLAVALSICVVPLAAFAQDDAQQVLNRFKDEPSIAETQDAAVQHAGYGSERLQSMYTRAGVARILPKSLSYSFRYKDEDRSRRQVDATKKTTSGGAEENTEKNIEYTQPTDTMQHDIKAQWDLSGLVYNADQLRVVSEMSRSAKQRDALLGSVTKIYFARRKAQIKLMNNPPSDVTERLNMELSIQEYTANLDALTGGWFSKNLKTKGLK